MKRNNSHSNAYFQLKSAIPTKITNCSYTLYSILWTPKSPNSHWNPRFLLKLLIANIPYITLVVVLWFGGWGNEHHNAVGTSRDLARASSGEADCRRCCVAGTRGVRSSLCVDSRVIRRGNADKGLRWRCVGGGVLSGCLWALSARFEALPGRVVSGCCVASGGTRGYWRRHLCQGKHLLLWVLRLSTRWQHVHQRIVVNAPASCDIWYQKKL